MSFFIRNKTRKDNKKVKNNNGFPKYQKNKKKTKHNLKKDLDEEILSDELEDEELDLNDEQSTKKRKTDDENYSSDQSETVQDKKIRLAKKYLAELSEHDTFNKSDYVDGQDDDNRISTQLKESVLDKLGKLHRGVADNIRIDPEKSVIQLKNGHRKTITVVVISHDGQFVFTASKDCNIVKWDRTNGKRLKTIYGIYSKKPGENEETIKKHSAQINALAISSDMKFLASGCQNKIIHIWCPINMTHLHTFRGHRAPITGLIFRRSFHQLFSCSEDRMIKVWDLDGMGYVESLFGHYDSITAIDSFISERCLTAGGRDGTIRLWKIPEESNLIFLTGGQASIDCVKFVDESHFISACDDGSISLWATFKKKPLYTMQATHQPGYWITSLASLNCTDLFASGSHNGSITFWKIKPEFKGFEKLFDYQVDGFVNGMQFSVDGRYLIAGISQEHRMGRWFERCRQARNVVHIIPLSTS